MASSAAEPVLIVSPRYADDVAGMVAASGMIPRIERRAEQAHARFAAEPVRLLVVDARGALAAGMGVARELGPAVEQRRGAMLVLLSRNDAGQTAAAHDAGATGVLVSPFGTPAFVNAMRLAARHTIRLAEAAATSVETSGPPDGDRLTGLATGDQLEQWLTERIGAPRQARPLFMVSIGVGRFAQINAAYGREVADRLLVAVAQRLSTIADGRHGNRPGTTRLLARLAAAEFGFGLAGNVTLEQAQRLAAALVQAFQRPFAIGERLIHLSGRAGIAAAGAATERTPGEAAATLVREALAALALARTRDAGAVEVFRPDPGGDPLTRLADLESDLHQAIEEDRIALVYQPQLALGSGRIEGVEALVRWEHPALGLLSATTLLETAASAEMAVRLGRHIRNRAIREVAGWTGALAGLKLSLNCTAADLADPEFASALAQALATGGLAPGRLVLEVTEGALIEDLGAAAALLDVLRRDGVQVSLDDFGTGYSSLSRLARLPVDTIKLDRDFTQGLTGQARERIIVQGVVAIAHALEMRVIAEGVEDDIQLDAARRAGCDAVQGYCVAAPLDPIALAAFCHDWQLSEVAE